MERRTVRALLIKIYSIRNIMDRINNGYYNDCNSEVRLEDALDDISAELHDMHYEIVTTKEFIDFMRDITRED